MAKIVFFSFHFWLFYTILLATLLGNHGGSAQENALSPARREELAILDSLFRNYDSRINPGGNQNGSQPTHVSVNMYVRSIQNIDDVKMEVRMQLTFRQQWVDNRLIFKPPKSHPDLAYLSLRDSTKAWTPDIFFSNEKEGNFHEFPQRNEYLRIFPNGEVLLSQRISLTLSCPMVLKLYPLDKQVCSIRMASYGYTTKDVIIKWKATDPVQVTSELHLPRFALEQFNTDYCDSQTNTGIYSCIRVDFLFKREFSYYLIQLYIPLCNLVIVAWFSFWLDAKSSLMARLALCLFSLGLMFALSIWTNSGTPPVSYTKAMDVWTGVCLTFVFFALAETIVAYRLARSNCGQQDGLEEAVDLNLPAVNLKEKFQKYWKSVGGCSNKLDFLVRILYALAFFLFLILYACAYAWRKADSE